MKSPSPRSKLRFKEGESSKSKRDNNDHKMTPNHQQLIDIAKPLVRAMILGREDFSAGTVASAIRSNSGRIYTGVCIHLSCGIGFCAEHAAAAEMIKGGETRISAIVAVADDCVLAPCGRCREFLLQIDPLNADCEVILNQGRVVRLRDLLPEHWLSEPSEHEAR
jgi:cytidine deaminase